MIIPGISLQYSIYSLGLYTSSSFYIFTALTMIILVISPQYSFCISALYTTCFTTHTALSKLHNSIHTLHSPNRALWDTYVRKTNKMHTFLHNVFLDGDTLRMIVWATRCRLRCTVNYYKLPVQNSWGWTITCSKHVEDNLSEIN